MEKHVLRLYVLGETPVAKRAIDNLKALCAVPEVQALYQCEVINLLDRPQLAEEERIIATPLLVKRLPPPLRRIIGDLSDHEKVLVGLDIQPDSSGDTG